MGCLAHAIVTNERFESPQLKDASVTLPFLARQHPVTAARQNHHRRVGETLSKWLINIERVNMFRRIVSRKLGCIGVKRYGLHEFGNDGFSSFSILEKAGINFRPSYVANAQE